MKMSVHCGQRSNNISLDPAASSASGMLFFYFYFIKREGALNTMFCLRAILKHVHFIVFYNFTHCFTILIFNERQTFC